MADNTIVVFSSDNGTTHLGQEVDYEFFNSVGELRGLKGSLYEGGVRVPTLVRWPGKIQAGSTTDYISGFEDWLPSLLGLAGLPPADSDGVNLAPTLLGKGQPERPFLYREFPGYGGQQSIRVGKWKAIRQGMGKGNLEVQLYDMDEDIAESKDVAGQFPEMVAKLSQMMSQQRSPSTRFPLIPLDAPPVAKQRKAAP